MNSKMKLSIVLLIALCLITSLVAVSCSDKGEEETGTDTVSVSDTLSDESGAETTAGTTEAQTTTEAAAETIGTGDGLSDDGFIKVPWGSGAQ